MKTNAINLRSGNIIEKNSKLLIIIKADIIQPGKGAAVVQVEMRDIISGAKDNVRYRTQETVEKIRLDQDDYQFLYGDKDSGFEFMQQETFEQINLSHEILGDKAQFLQEGMVIVIESYEEKPLGIQLPDTIIMEISETEPVIKGQTASSSYKPATLENGARVMVPPHIGVGTKIVVRTEDGSYMEKAK